MTHQIVTVHHSSGKARAFIQDVDLAVDFASWCQACGYEVEMSEGFPEPTSPTEDAVVAALTDMYARTRA